jgi:hypothetical protein
VALKSCTVIIHDLNLTEHALDVTAETLYEAVAQALAALGANDWAGDIGRGHYVQRTLHVGPRETTQTQRVGE